MSALLGASAVTDIVDSRVYAMPAPQGTRSPFITYQLASRDPDGRTYGGAAADANLFQVDCWLDTTASTASQSALAQIRTLADAVRVALVASGLTLWQATRDLSTPADTRRSLDFLIIVKG